MVKISTTELASLNWRPLHNSEPIASCIVSGHGTPILELDEMCLEKLGIRLSASASGPGSHLKALLAGFGIHSGPDCKCNRRAAYMDEMGCDWCEANIEEIVGWLRESAAERGLPFLDAVGKLVVRRAISNARREEARYAAEAEEKARPAV